jgi:hypothetical protein
MWGKIRRTKALSPRPIGAADSPPDSSIPAHIGHRRRDCWWEPIYNPDVALEPDPYDWDLKRDAGPSRRYIAGQTLDARLIPGDTFKVVDVTFRECDFQGAYRASPVVMFDECRFVGCDFAYSSWRGAHFRKCAFTDTSLSLSSFEKCEFRDCTWERVGIASKTDFERTFVSNPGALISATVSQTNPKDRSWRHRIYQWHRLLSTRAHVLRSLMLSHSTVGDEHVFYETVKLHELQRHKARMAEDLFTIAFSPLDGKMAGGWALPAHLLNFGLMNLFGLTNKWGESTSRPCLVFGLIFWGFAEIYQRVKFNAAIPHPFQKSLDITLLVGYSNQVAPSDPLLTITQNIQVTMAVIVYTVFFSTVVSKLSRAR